MILERARRVLEIEAGAVAALIPRLNDDFVRAVDILYECQGRVVLTGMGKSTGNGASTHNKPSSLRDLAAAPTFSGTALAF